MTSTGLRLGFALNFRTTSHDSETIRRTYEEVLDTITYAEELGIDSVWVGQHHFDNTDGPIPSPLVFLAAAAQRTERIVLGTGITTLPFEDPIRLAEDAALLDVLSGGRLHLGLGTGGANLNGFASFGLDSSQRHAIFDDKIAALHRVLDGASLTSLESGPHLYPPGAGIRTRLWQAATSVVGARSAARAGDGLQQGAFFDPADTGQRPKVEAYLEEWRASGRHSEPRVAVFRFVYPGSSKEQVARQIEPVLGPRLSFLAERAALSGNPTLRGISVSEYLDRVPVYGAPDDIAEQVLSDPAIDGLATDFVANFSYSDDFDATHAKERLDVLAHEIGPRIGWHRAAGAYAGPPS